MAFYEIGIKLPPLDPGCLGPRCCCLRIDAGLLGCNFKCFFVSLDADDLAAKAFRWSSGLRELLSSLRVVDDFRFDVLDRLEQPGAFRAVFEETME